MIFSDNYEGSWESIATLGNPTKKKPFDQLDVCTKALGGGGKCDRGLTQRNENTANTEVTSTTRPEASIFGFILFD